MGDSVTEYNARWYQRAAIWIGIGINPASLTLGGGLASRLPLSSLYWLIPLGGLTISAIAATSSIIGRRRREPFAKRAQSTFGVGFGSILLSAIMVLGMIGWSGFQHGLAGTSFGNMLGVPSWVGSIVMALFWFALVNAGTNKWNAVVWITTVASFALVFVSLGIVQEQTFNSAPVEPFSLETAVWAIGSMIAFATLFSLRSNDFAWDMASDFDVVLDGLSFCLSFTISTFVGALLYQSTGEWDLAIILDGTRLAILAQIFLIISLMGPALSTKHSGALAWGQLTKMSYRTSVAVIMGVGLFLGIIRFDRQLLLFLDWIGAIMPPALAVMIMVSVLKRRVNTAVAVTAWLVGALVAVIIKLSGQSTHLIIGAVTSILLLLILLRSEQSVI